MDVREEKFINLVMPENRAKVYRVRSGFASFPEVFDKDYKVRLYRGVWFPIGEKVDVLRYPGDFWTYSLYDAQSYARVIGLGKGTQQIYYVDLNLSDIISRHVKILIEEPTVWEEGIILPKELQRKSKLLSSTERGCGVS